ncbi:MAG: malonic semialdehyde reductase [Rothia sp. (in: high G+C Gram-positive bacteria)]|nr:malonic semialdehyde reductase [Rothia sp. (in: high G+C Gram-positive bacteria)]
MSAALPQESLELLFSQPRTVNHFTDQEVSQEDLKAIWDLTKMGPTAFNAQPLRVTFLRSAQARERLIPLLAEGNQEKTKDAPVTAILSFDTNWSARFEEFNPMAAQMGMASLFTDETARHAAGYQSANIAAGYFITAIRALGLAAGPMTGADFKAIDQEFYPDGQRRSFLIVNIGYGVQPSYPRNKRFDFEDVTEIL